MSLDTSILDQVKSSTERVAAEARYVRIDRARIPEYVSILALQPKQGPCLEAVAGRYTGSRFLEITFLWHAINFGSGYFPYIRKRDGLSGSRSLLATFLDRCEDQRLNLETCSCLDARDVAAILGQDHQGPTGQLMSLYAAAWSELAAYVETNYRSIPALVESAKNSADRLVAIMAAIPSWADRARYNSGDVWFLKRAQVLVADVNTVCCFADMHKATLGADNLIAHVLRLDGLLVYSHDLVAKIEHGVNLEPGSGYEIEVRACTVQVGEMLASAAAAAGKGLASWEFGQILWMRGQRPAYKQRPRHRCLCTYY